MHEALLVGEIQALGDVGGDVEDVRHAQAALGDAILERAAGDVFGRQVVHAGVAADVVHRHQVRMLELGGDLAFGEEAAGELGIGRQDRRHHLQRDLAVQRLLHRQEDRGHAAFADRAEDAVAGNVDVDRSEQDRRVQENLTALDRVRLSMMPAQAVGSARGSAEGQRRLPALPAILASRASWAAASASLARSTRRTPATGPARSTLAAAARVSPTGARPRSPWPAVRPR